MRLKSTPGMKFKRIKREGRLPVNILLVEGTSQFYCYSSLMIYSLVRAYFEGRLEEFLGQVKKERDSFLASRGR